MVRYVGAEELIDAPEPRSEEVQREGNCLYFYLFCVHCANNISGQLKLNEVKEERKKTRPRDSFCRDHNSADVSAVSVIKCNYPFRRAGGELQLIRKDPHVLDEI